MQMVNERAISILQVRCDGEIADLYCQEVTTIAKRIFGDIVANAWVVLTDDSSDVQEEIKHLRHEKTVIDASSAQGLVIIEFSNGKRVQFYTSEWGSIEPLADPSEA